jgi:L-aspartate oxidase
MADLEFIQFHPTALAVSGAPRFLISEALRGEGGILLNIRGEAFMSGYDKRAELAPRDIVSRSIHFEMERTSAGHVWLDMRHLDHAFVRDRFPKIFNTCLLYNVDITRDLIPVSPAAHYAMGGVRTDTFGKTSVVGLYAAGEVACTGVHGANRLASNSLLEGLVFGARAGVAATEGALAGVIAGEPRGGTLVRKQTGRSTMGPEPRSSILCGIRSALSGTRGVSEKRWQLLKRLRHVR